MLLEDAIRLLGELNAYSHLVPDVDFFIQMPRNQRSYDLESNRGTKTNIDEAVLPEEEVDPER